VMVDGGAGVIVMPVSTFEKLGFSERELMKTNTSLSSFTGVVTETRGVMLVELTVGSKTKWR
jgi:predicted aspartyl protease